MFYIYTVYIMFTLINIHLHPYIFCRFNWHSFFFFLRTWQSCLLHIGTTWVQHREWIHACYTLSTACILYYYTLCMCMMQKILQFACLYAAKNAKVSHNTKVKEVRIIAGAVLEYLDFVNTGTYLIHSNLLHMYRVFYYISLQINK